MKCECIIEFVDFNIMDNEQMLWYDSDEGNDTEVECDLNLNNAYGIKSKKYNLSSADSDNVNPSHGPNYGVLV